MGALRIVLLVCAVAFAAIGSASPGAVATTREDPQILEALRDRDVYASTGQLGDFAGVVEERLQVKTQELRARGVAVKLLLAPPITGEDVFAYAARIRGALGFDGTLVVTTPTGPVGAAGPRSVDSVRGAFQAARVDGIASPTQRLITSAELALPAPSSSGSGIRELLVLIGLTLLGGAWAIAWGLRREQRKTRAVSQETRARLRVCLDALGARIAALRDTEPLPPRVADLLTAAHADHAEALAAVAGHASEEHDRALLRLRRGLERVQEAGELLDRPQPMENPFLGLCAVDPAHGPATAVARLDDRPLQVPVCAACRARIDLGDPPRRRLIPVGGRPVPFDEADIRFPPLPGD